MKKLLAILLVVAFISCLASESIFAGDDYKTKICPGKGERCMKVKIKLIGISFWKRKAKGGPSVVIIDEL